MVTRADRQIGALLKLLRDKGMDGNTLVFFTSDNGGTGGDSGPGHRLDFFRSNGNLRGQKGNLYEGGIRAPMIARWKGRIREGAVSDFPWAFWDVMPTLAEIAGTDAPAGDGISVLPSLLGKSQNPERFLYWEQHGFDRSRNDLRRGSMSQAARHGDWKVVRQKPDAPLELYNLRRDPSETTDVSGRNPEIAARMESYLKSARSEPRPHNKGSFEFIRD
jgi:arylsulfatase A-like enzyme